MKWLNNINPFYWKRRALSLQSTLDHVAKVRLTQEQRITVLTDKWRNAEAEKKQLQEELEKAKALNDKWFSTIVGFSPVEAILLNQSLRGKPLTLDRMLDKLERIADEREDSNNA